MSRLTRDGTAEPISRDQILRRERGQGNIHFSCSADHVQDWQPYPVDPYSCYTCDHTYCRESAGTGPVVLNVAQVTGTAFSGITLDQFLCASLLMVCRTKERIAQSTRARAGSLALVE